VRLAAADLPAPGAQVRLVAIESRSQPDNTILIDAFQRTLSDDGIDGVSVARVSVTEAVVLPDLAPDLLLCLGSQAAEAARRLDLGVDAVYAMVADPQDRGLHGPGVSLEPPWEHRLRILREVLPGARYHFAYSRRTPEVDEIREVGARLGLDLSGMQLESPAHLLQAAGRLLTGADAFLILPDVGLITPTTVQGLIAEGLRRGVPVIGLSPSYTRAGALVSVDADPAAAGAAAARAWHAGSSEHLHPETVRVAVNVTVARRLGISLPESIGGVVAIRMGD
jgi:ABC-type uncharacterized transport system substrate-binding protein